MKHATTRPTQPSIIKAVNRPTSIAASTAVVAMASDRLSVAVASMAAEDIRLPIRRLYRYIYSFTAMDATRIPTASRLKSTASGCRIFSTEDFPSSTPISRISPDTTSPEIYSMRPWPKGCWGSGFFPAN